jgi:hypothetical protein
MFKADEHFGQLRGTGEPKIGTLQFVQIADCILQSARCAIIVYSIAAFCTNRSIHDYAIEPSSAAINMIHGGNEMI